MPEKEVKEAKAKKKVEALKVTEAKVKPTKPTKPPTEPEFVIQKPAETATLEKVLENSIALQKLLTGLAGELKSLNRKLTFLVDLFEEASKTFKGKTPVSAAPAELLDKVDKLTEQNKTIAKGMLLLERTIRELRETLTGSSKEESYKPLPEL